MFALVSSKESTRSSFEDPKKRLSVFSLLSTSPPARTHICSFTKETKQFQKEQESRITQWNAKRRAEYTLDSILCPKINTHKKREREKKQKPKKGSRILKLSHSISARATKLASFSSSNFDGACFRFPTNSEEFLKVKWQRKFL